MDFHLRINHNIITLGLLHHLIKSIIGTSGNEITNDGSSANLGAAEQMLPVNAENACDGSFTSHLIGKGEVVGMVLNTSVGLSHAVTIGVSTSQEEAHQANQQKGKFFHNYLI